MRDQILMSIACLVISLGSVAIAGWILISGGIVAQGIDALFLITVCLLIAASFAFIPIQDYRSGLFQSWIGEKRTSAKSAKSHPEPDEAQKARREASSGS